jgi:hypothetical protein
MCQLFFGKLVASSNEYGVSRNTRQYRPFALELACQGGTIAVGVVPLGALPSVPHDGPGAVFVSFVNAAAENVR